MTSPPPKTILFIHHFPSYSGAAESMLTLIRHLDPARYTASVLIVHPIAEPLLSTFRSMGISVQHVATQLVWDAPWLARNNLQTRAWRAFRSDPQIAEHLRTARPDIVHINEFVPVSTGITAHELNIPVIWHCRHVLARTRAIIDPGRRIISTMAAIAHSIVCISESEAEQFPASKVDTIYNPLDFARIDAVRGRGPTVRQSLGIKATDYVVVAPISLSTTKGAWDYIRACGIAAKVAPQNPMHFLIVGDLPTTGRRHLLRKWTGFMGPKPDLDRAHDLARSVGIEGRIQFTGFRDDIYEIMDGSDLIVFPSHLRACGRACFEAGALKKPILVTMPNKNTGVVLDGETGLILPDNDPETLGRAIADLARDRARGIRMGEKGFENVRSHFGADDHAEKLMAIYDRAGGEQTQSPSETLQETL